MARTKRRNFIISVTLTEQGVDGFEDGQPDSSYEVGGCYKCGTWRENIQELLRQHLPDDYTTEVEVLMLTDQGDA